MIGNLTPPQRFSGTPQEQLRQMFTYLFQTIEILNLQLAQLDNTNTDAQAQIDKINNQIKGIQDKIGQFMADGETGE